MTDTTNTPTQSNTTPTHYVYQVRKGRDKNYFTKIGAAWPHNDGKGFNITIDSMPFDGRMALRIVAEKQDQ